MSSTGSTRYLCVLSIATEVEHEIYLVHVYASHIALIEYVFLTSLELNVLHEVVSIVIAFLGKLDSNIVVVGGREQLGREVVRIVCVGSHICVEVHLCLPLVCSGGGQLYDILVAVGSKRRISYLRPTRSIVERIAVLA